MVSDELAIITRPASRHVNAPLVHDTFVKGVRHHLCVPAHTVRAMVLSRG